MRTTSERMWMMIDPKLRLLCEFMNTIWSHNHETCTKNVFSKITASHSNFKMLRFDRDLCQNVGIEL